MKVKARRKKQVNLEDQVFTLSFAKTFLGRLMEKASRGKPVYIQRNNRRFMLQEIPLIEPIPMRPPGFFANAYTPAEIAGDNSLAKASVIKAPADLE